ncbi:replicative DNA helicase [Sulfurospirillum arcachonense]|uniref:replicative DNA helicase n=1 Tax=Sulfurospirillum arcachonense TaxID=57666 RepID=UPI000469A68F|nr:replicative DNA helicase [Sulfurospirillum arcachonense]
MDNLHNINIERSVLSSILFNPATYEEVASNIKPRDFYLPAHKYIFEAMEECEREDLPIDEEFVKKKLKQEERFDEEVMLEILSTNPLPSIKAYVEEIREKSIKRDLVKLTGDIREVAVEKDLPSSEVVDLVQQKLYQITSDSSSKEFRESSEMTNATIQHILEMKKRGNAGVVGLDTGFAEINRLTTGFGAGDLIIVAARPAMGKTAFTLNLAQKAIDDNKGVAIFSLEMPAEQLMLRMLSAKTSIPLQKLKVGDMSDDEWSRLNSAADTMSQKKLFVDDNGNVNIHNVRAKLRKLKTQHPEISLCVIDYLQLMTGAGNKDRHQEVSDISRGLKLLARELEMPIIALSQLNRGVESRHDKRPMMSDIRESGSIEQDADMIMFVYRDDIYRMREEKDKEQKARVEGKEYKSNFFDKPEESAEIIIGKNRNGPIGVANLLFQKACTKFIDAGGIPIEVVYDESNMDGREATISMQPI